MLTFGFYNSVNEDRKYNATQMSSMFDGVINDGIFKDVGQAFNVSDGSGMQVVVGTGRAWFNHTWNYNELALLLTVEASELILDRIDTVVLEIDGSDEVRTNSLKVIKGTPGESPVAPTMIQSNPKYQYPLCDIYVAAEVSGLSAFNLTSRIGNNDCPYVVSIIEASFADNSLTTLKMATEQKRGVALGVASLDSTGQVPLTQLGNSLGIITATATLVESGDYDVYSTTITGVITYTNFKARIKFNKTCNSTYVDINVNGLGDKRLRAGGNRNLKARELIAGRYYTIIWDGAYMQIMELGNEVRSNLNWDINTIYVDSTANRDLEDGSSEYPFTSISNALASLPKYLEVGVTINVRNAMSSCNVKGFFGDGITIASSGGMWDISSQCSIEDCASKIWVTGFNFTRTVGDNIGVINSQLAIIQSCNFITPSTHDAVKVSDISSNAKVVGCTISNHNAAINSYEGKIYSLSNSGTGNTYGLRTQGGIIVKAGTQPSGATAEYITADSGGRIV